MLKVGLIFVFVAGVLSQTTDPDVFNCNRGFGGDVCTDGVCDTTSGFCTCNPGFDPVLGIYCITTGTPTCTTRACENGGSCKTVGGVDACYCPEGFYGDLCENKALDAMCLSDSMVISVRPNAVFDGVVYLKGMKEECAFTVDATDSSLFTRTFPYVALDNCTVTKDTTLLTGSDADYKASFIIQYVKTPDVILALDIQVDLTCSVRGTQISEAKIDTDYANKVTPGEVIDYYNPVTLSVRDADTDAEISGTVSISKKLKLKFDMPAANQGIFGDFSVRQCRAYSDFGMTQNELPMITDGCSGGLVTSENPAKTGTPASNADLSVAVPFKAFAYYIRGVVSASPVFIKCSLNLCTAAGDPNCAGCATRRKREAITTIQANFTTLSATFTVAIHDNPTFNPSSVNGSLAVPPRDVCLGQPGLQATLSIMGVTIIGLIVGIVVAVAILCRPMHSDSGRSMDDARSVSSSMTSTTQILPSI